MPLLNQIQAIVAALPVVDSQPNNFLYGTSKELNVKADEVINGCSFCLYPMQPIDISLGVNGSADNSFSLYLEILYLTKFENLTQDNEVIVNKALKMANKFLVDLRDYVADPAQGRYFKWPPGTRARALPIYNKHDANTSGVSLQFSVQTRYDDYLLNC